MIEVSSSVFDVFTEKDTGKTYKKMCVKVMYRRADQGRATQHYFFPLVLDQTSSRLGALVVLKRKEKSLCDDAIMRWWLKTMLANSTLEDVMMASLLDYEESYANIICEGPFCHLGNYYSPTMEHGHPRRVWVNGKG